MLKTKNRIGTIVIAIFLTISMSASMMLIPNANAQTLAPGKISIPTYAFITVNPNPAGIGQSVTVDFWIDLPPPTANIVWGDRYQNLKVTVTKPDGTTQTLGPFTSDDTGGTTTQFTPSVLGNYTFQMSYPGQTLTGGTGYAGSQNQQRAAQGLSLLSTLPYDINGPSYVSELYWNLPLAI